MRRYTREAGVRQLERVVGRVARKVALSLEQGGTVQGELGSEEIETLMGNPTFPRDILRGKIPPGVAAALAWTESGGDILYVEAVLLKGGREIQLTGQLGEVMRESAHAARSYIWSQHKELSIDANELKSAGLHIHIPAGAVPKDGPSAGITIATALASLLMKRTVRSDTAMTGEMSLTGLVLPVGGIKEKVLAAHRSGLKRVILPEGNMRDLNEVNEEIRQSLDFVFVENMQDVLSHALELDELTDRRVKSVS